ncbi:MAG: hypothetical protein NVSMB51_12850 [Solirubrobacteraceae bacterium]
MLAPVTSLIYRSAPLYEAVMRALYGRHYHGRYEALAELVPHGASVLDLCCGPGVLYTRFLRGRQVRYTALDLNARFVEQLSRAGVDARVWDVSAARPLPHADYVIIQASLYHFLPRAQEVVERMVQAAGVAVVIAEPIRNLATSRVGALAAAGRRLTDPGTGEQEDRFTEATLDELMSSYGERLRDSFLIPGGREKVFVLAGAARS